MYRRTLPHPGYGPSVIRYSPEYPRDSHLPLGPIEAAIPKMWNDGSLTSAWWNIHMCFLRDIAFKKPTFMSADCPTLPDPFSGCYAVLLVLFSSVGRGGVSAWIDGPTSMALPFDFNDLTYTFCYSENISPSGLTLQMSSAFWNINSVTYSLA